jgi:hypothetical protein
MENPDTSMFNTENPNKDYLAFLEDKNINYYDKNDFENVGRFLMKQVYEQNKDYRQKAKKTFQKEKDEFSNAVKVLNKEDKFNEDVEEDLQKIYCDPDKEALANIFKSLVATFNELSNKNKLSGGVEGKKEKKSQPLKPKSDTFYNKFEKKKQLPLGFSKRKTAQFYKEPVIKRATIQQKSEFWKKFERYNNNKKKLKN